MNIDISNYDFIQRLTSTDVSTHVLD